MTGKVFVPKPIVEEIKGKIPPGKQLSKDVMGTHLTQTEINSIIKDACDKGFGYGALVAGKNAQNSRPAAVWNWGIIRAVNRIHHNGEYRGPFEVVWLKDMHDDTHPRTRFEWPEDMYLLQAAPDEDTIEILNLEVLSQLDDY